MQQNVRITDFGLSHLDEEPKRLDTKRGYSFDVKGTIPFMAPEIIFNMDQPHSVKYGVAVDWWALGCVFYELISLPKQDVCISSYLVAILLISSRQVLFDSKDAIMNYLAWHDKNDWGPGLFPPFEDLEPFAANLLTGVSSLYHVKSPSLTFTLIVA